MLLRECLAAAAGACLLLACAGCEPVRLKLQPEPASQPVPPEVAGTVAEYADLVGGPTILVDGYGLVVGLGRSGSSEVPPKVRDYLVQLMLRHKIGSPTAGTDAVTPSQILADKDTAVVRVVGAVPAGAPADWTFDVQVSALPQTSTTSLDGGALMPAELRLAVGADVPPDVGSKPWVEAQGTIFLNPFLDPTSPGDAARLREGRIIGGGRVLHSRPLRLVLREADYARCDLIQRRINQRFGQGERVANARGASTIDLTIPPAYVQDYTRFLELVMHLPLQSEPARWEARARQIAQEMDKPGANCNGLALVWEAMGKEVIPVCRTLYASRNVAAAYHAARTGLRLRDELAGDAMIRLAGLAGSPLRVPAIEELGRNTWFSRSLPTLRGLIDDESELVRIAAYEALCQHGDTAVITRSDVGGEFRLDLVASRRAYVIYATQTAQKKIALFGQDMAVSQPFFFNMPGDLVTMADRADPNDGQKKLMVFRKIPRTGGISEPFYIDFSVKSLVQTLGQTPQRGVDGKVKGLGLTYGQVAAVLYRMCEVDKDIPARFALQPPPGVQRIYRGAATTGRPDMPGE